MNYNNRLDFFIIIADRKRKNDLVELIKQSGGRVINSLYGRGSVRVDSLLDIFGFVPEENKIIITSLLASDKSADLIETLNKAMNFNKPNTGIAFTVPVEGLSY